MRHPGPILLLLGVVACAGVGEDGALPDVAASTVLRAPPPPRPAPPLAGTSSEGERFTLESLEGERAVLVFYRGAFCSLCLRRLRDLAEHQGDYDDLDARIVAFTPDRPELTGWTRQELDLEYPIVSVDRATLDRWGVWPGGERFPRPASYVVDEAGGVRYGHVGATAVDRLSDLVLLEEVETLAAAPPAAADR